MASAAGRGAAAGEAEAAAPTAEEEAAGGVATVELAVTVDAFAEDDEEATGLRVSCTYIESRVSSLLVRVYSKEKISRSDVYLQ